MHELGIGEFKSKIFAVPEIVCKSSHNSENLDSFSMKYDALLCLLLIYESTPLEFEFFNGI